MAAVLSSRASLPRVRSLPAISRTLRDAARLRSRDVVRDAAPVAFTRPTVRASLPTAFASNPESVG
jgi:hypothetical protein